MILLFEYEVQIFPEIFEITSLGVFSNNSTKTVKMINAIDYAYHHMINNKQIDRLTIAAFHGAMETVCEKHDLCYDHFGDDKKVCKLCLNLKK